MASYTEDELLQSGQIVQALMNFESRDTSVDALLDYNKDIILADLEQDIIAFMDDLWVLSRTGYSVPTFPVGDYEKNDIHYVPVSLGHLLGFDQRPLMGIATRYAQRDHYLLEIFYKNLQDYFRRDSDYFTFVSHDDALLTFRERATAFLATRINATRNQRKNGGNGSSGGTILNLFGRAGGGGHRVATPGCLFSVTSNTPGLRVSWSGAYRISPNYFSHPTSPAKSVLQSGNYVFGVDGGAYSTIIWDHAVATLPGTPSIHLNF